MKEGTSRILQETQCIAEIGAPTFKERARARYVFKRMQKVGLRRIEKIGNEMLLGCVGDGKGRRLLLAAHLDTVFPDERIRPQKKKRRIIGPGVGDNALAVAAGIFLLERLQRWGCPLGGNLIFVATTCEEGLGNLRGITEVLNYLKGKVHVVLAIEGLFQGRLSYRAIGVNRWQVAFNGSGGDAWEDAGAPHANHALVRLGYSLISLVSFLREPRLNLSILKGGESINSIATSAQMSVDLRS